MNDYKQIKESPPEGISAAPISDENLFEWDAVLVGPSESIWEGGMFPMKLSFSEQYPDKPPSVKFLCEVFHPNVFPNGQICLDIIQKMWTPIYTISSILVSIQSLLLDPNIESPANPTAAHLYAHDKQGYNKRVRACAQKSAEYL
ncbi:putative Ubiquitin-conjugating enzyme E2-17 kDa [Blattamonas nauphoetae]|uniref:Ubiquitin-conjugating enzyme E2-17 kDa n=1 Tax=Blattamonas nauphoetae TaxID=2049346 RepID=A0ABQ9XWL3_9EUKA|nr:putative Ubiquitin-conjugating enzyme E2-17 kDa [Blattamonas nauphoetae]